MTSLTNLIVFAGLLAFKPSTENISIDKQQTKQEQEQEQEQEQQKQQAKQKQQQIKNNKNLYKREQRALRKQAKQDYKFSKQPESGYMTIKEYEQKSIDIMTSERDVDSYIPEKNNTVEYTPQPLYDLVKYNNPPGSPELNIGRKLQYDRQFVSPGIVSPDKSFLIYPVHNFYATNQCVTGDLYRINLDMTKTETQRVLDANIIKRIQTPILSTSKDISEKYIFRSLTPVDFSADGNSLLVKEKIGSIVDGIWQTNLWVYNFRTQKATILTEAQETVKYYWIENGGLFLEDKRWDIYPSGFSSEHPNIIIFNAYAYTGSKPMYLGTWSIDSDGEFTELVSLKGEPVKISMNGFKLAKVGLKEPKQIRQEAKTNKKKIKAKKRKEKQAKKESNAQKRTEYHNKIKEMKQREREVLKEMK